MKLRFLLLLLFFFAARPARAENAPAHAVFALIVTSNHGGGANRPDLRYADDDGVKYAELFRMLGTSSDVVLHTELDRDTERLYPKMKTEVKPPKRDDVLASAHAMAERVTLAIREGKIVDFYFVFAGHGDVDQGKGYLELADGRLGSDEVDAILSSMPATHAHVILDSCNSFFVLAARKPGGRVVATSVELGDSFGKRMPNVGVFLSTSAEAEVYEWSELQAGIFSHAVRSGLAGAADADGDGNVTYDELRAYVGVATDKIKNPQLRPHVFARGPAGADATPLVRLADARAKRVRLERDPDIRMTVRDSEDVPLVDLHKEAGATLEIVLPLAWAANATAERVEERDGKRVVHRFSIAGETGALALVETPAPIAARGAVEALATLFASPFGPRALAQFDSQPRQDEEVYGADREHMERLRLLLAEAAASEHDGRVGRGGALLAGAAVATATGAWLLTNEQTRGKLYPYELFALGAGWTFGGLYAILHTSGAETAYDDLIHLRTHQNGPPPTSDAFRERMAFADAEATLFALAEENRKARSMRRIAGILLVACGGTIFALNETGPASSDDERWFSRVYSLSLGAIGAAVLVDGFIPSPIERLAHLWAEDPGRARTSAALDTFRLQVAPIQGGATGGFSFRF